MENKVAREEDGTIILSIAIPQGLIKKTVNEIIEETAKSASIPGFRKGKAPRKLIEQKVDKEKIMCYNVITFLSWYSLLLLYFSIFFVEKYL